VGAPGGYSGRALVVDAGDPGAAAALALPDTVLRDYLVPVGRTGADGGRDRPSRLIAAPLSAANAESVRRQREGRTPPRCPVFLHWTSRIGTAGLQPEVGGGAAGPRRLADALELVRAGRAGGVLVDRLDRLASDVVVQEQLLAEVWRLALCPSARPIAGDICEGSPGDTGR